MPNAFRRANQGEHQCNILKIMMNYRKPKPAAA